MVYDGDGTCVEPGEGGSAFATGTKHDTSAHIVEYNFQEISQFAVHFFATILIYIRSHIIFEA